MSLKKLPSNKTRRTDSKQVQMLAMLQRNQGATIAAIMEATGCNTPALRDLYRKSTEHNLDQEFNSLDAQRETCIKSQAPMTVANIHGEASAAQSEP